jgi:hypothetical protein
VGVLELDLIDRPNWLLAVWLDVLIEPIEELLGSNEMRNIPFRDYRRRY